MPKAQKIEGTFGNSAQARHYEERIINQLIAWGIPDGTNPARYIGYSHTEESRGPGGIPLWVPCELCGHPIIYKQMCEQVGPGAIRAMRVLGCDCVVNYSIVDPSQARLAELRTAELQKAFQQEQKAKRAEERKVLYAEQFKDVLDYVKAFKALNGEQAYLPRCLWDAQRAIQSGEHGDKKMKALITPALTYMTINPIDHLAEAKARREADLKAQTDTELAGRRDKFGAHLEFILQKVEEEPGNEFWCSMRDKFNRHLTDITGWAPTPNMVGAVERQIKRAQPQNEEANVHKYQDLISRVEAIAHIQWSDKQGYMPGVGPVPSQKEKFNMVDDIVGKLVQYGDFSSEKQKETFMRNLEKLEQWAKGKEARRK
jgi:hypothetical protein